MTCPYTVGKLNPLPWTEKWIGGGNVQVAPQETEITSYVTGGVKQDVDQEKLSTFRWFEFGKKQQSKKSLASC